MDINLTWQKSPSSNVQQYVATFTYNGADQPPITVPANAAQDASGYSLDLGTSIPSIVLKAGDVVGASVVAVDTVDPGNLTSTADVATPVTVPSVPTAPQPPVNALLTLS